MELMNHLKSVDKVGSRFPSPFANFVTVPKDKILQFLSVDVRIKDIGNFEFLFTINLDCRWRCL